MKHIQVSDEEKKTRLAKEMVRLAQVYAGLIFAAL